MISNYQMKYKDPKRLANDPNKIKFQNKAKSNNIDPFAEKLKKPVARETSY